ncbi:sulfatase-like hydrolase/transferase [Clostridium botulinum C]|uniref:Sulfatase n=2 Tax=Clostridium botulinum TaxID=1491 RepID=A0A9Q4XT59_CLOBO|nr:sulfatase-like hydrolase/transferase [Clostridium botulinum]MCD3194091.1 sulfatase-like hydrolase/transferase [Clostridium botulinum C]MCD3199280.1 sulfatase-like hydrolase/transferase [Clostridium botulinum C]MCD3204755.1 sulfatase-like hydrolase/transferase [Clostridium botulinum C]MCD3208098.1 sulfatase-like hydrolase/transferase [Clostridium botulinum C]MCD3215989.1 sulfatase-like hydrolase/transferase [Clostridium botulinum C]
MIELKKAREIKENIKNLVEEQKLDMANELIYEYKNIIDFDLEVENISAIVDFYKGNLEKAEKKLLNIYNKFEFNFDVNYNLGIVYMYMKEYEKATKHYIRSMCIDKDKSNLGIKELEFMVKNKKITTENLNKIKYEQFEIFTNYQKVFPKGINKTNYIEQNLTINNKDYSTGIYDYYFAERDGILKEYDEKISGMYKFELIESNVYDKFSLKTTKTTVIPIMIKSEDIKIQITVNKKQYSVKNILPNRYYYYRFNKNEDIKIHSKNGKFVLGKPIYIEFNTKIPKLVLNIFIDGLSEKFIEDEGLKNVMPNAYKFFQKGTICENAYVSGDWTYVSLASFFTGMYTTNHKVYHPDYNTFSLYNKELYSEIFNKNGYYTAKIDGDWRSTPSNGYVKGIDRYIYQTSLRGMHTDEVINETIEHLDAFKEKNNFVWICLPDLHDIADEFENRISVQVNNPIETRIFDKTNETSVRKIYDKKKIFKYGTQLKRIDRYLGLLFNYIKENYKEDEYIISLVADHGQGYFIKDKFLDDGRTKVAMMFRGKNIPIGKCSEMIQGLDLFPIILNAAEINDVHLKDGNLPKYFGGKKGREFTYTESIFPGSPYRATINDLDHKFFFETKEDCEKDGRIKIDGYTVELINKHTNQNETDIYKEKVKKYLDVIFQHIKEYIII